VLAALVLLGVAALGSGGCSTSEEVPPRDRIGAMPFPGLFTLHHTIDPDDLGRHRYRRWPRWFQVDERERGILYTTRAGFLDLAHVRLAIDWARYSIREIHRAVDAGKSQVSFAGPDGSVFHVSLHYPPDWSTIPEDERQQVIDELSLRTGQQISYLMQTWHEIITWFGYSTVFFVSESMSSFSYEDTMSHIVGLRVVERAMANRELSYDDAVTAALDAEMKELGVVTSAQADEAALAVEGVWWKSGRPLKRHLDIGLEEHVVYPWLVPGLPFGGDHEPEPFHLPRLDNIRGRDLTGFYTVEIEPNIWQTGAMRRHLPDHPKRFRQDRDIPILLQVVRSQMQTYFGAAVSEPRLTPTPSE